MPSSVQASRMYSTEVKPVPSSREEKRRVPMVLVKVEGVAILRPPSSKGYRKKKSSYFILQNLTYQLPKYQLVYKESLDFFSQLLENMNIPHTRKLHTHHSGTLWRGWRNWASYLHGVMSFQLSVGSRSWWCRRFVVVHNLRNKLLNVHHSITC